MTALQDLINEGAIVSVGGATQQAWATPFKLEIVATMEPIIPAHRHRETWDCLC